MPYSKDNNYTPESFNDVMTRFMQGVNEKFGTFYTLGSFVGTGFYKFFYVATQSIIAMENVFAETYAKLQDYIRTTNETIAIPKTPREGLINTFVEAGYVISLEPQTKEKAGTLGICVDIDAAAADYDIKKKEILQMLAQYTVAGLYYAGDQRGEVTISNGQNFEFAFYTPQKKEMALRLTITLSKNTNILADNEDKIKEKLLKNLSEYYGLGKNFEPAKYFTISRDAPYASAIALEWKTNSEYSSEIYETSFRDLFLFEAARIEVVFK